MSLLGLRFGLSCLGLRFMEFSLNHCCKSGALCFSWSDYRSDVYIYLCLMLMSNDGVSGILCTNDFL